MIKKRIFISCRINEMRLFREAAVRAIEAAGMEPVYFDSTDAQKRWALKPGISVIQQLLEGVKTADAFLGLYGQTLNTNWTPEGYDKHSMELEYDTAEAIGLPCFFYVPPSGVEYDEDMARFRKRVMQKAVEFLTTPEELHDDLLAKLKALKPRIFISYSSKDQSFVDQLYARLKESGHYVWLNTESIPKGEHWHDEMTKGLEETDILILVVSPEAMASKWVTEEWKTFLQAQKKVIPILYRSGKTPKAITRLEMIKTQKDDWYYRLLKALEGNLIRHDNHSERGIASTTSSQEQKTSFKNRLENLKKAQLKFQAEFQQTKAMAEQLRETIAHDQRPEERTERSRLLAKLERQIQEMEPQIAKRERSIQDMERALSSL